MDLLCITTSYKCIYTEYTGLESDFQAKTLAAVVAGMLALGSSSMDFSLSYTRSYMTEKEQIANVIL